jgi:hypothetical protein
VAIVLPAGFERAAGWAAGGERPPVEILHHPTTSAERQWAEGVLTETVMRQLARDRFGGLADAALAPPFKVEAAAVSPHPGASFNSY